MITWLVFVWKVYWARRSRDKFRNKLEKFWLDWSKRDPQHANKPEHFYPHAEKMSFYSDKINLLTSNYWIRRAERVVVPLPQGESMWERDEDDGRYLSHAGVQAIRKAVWEVGRDRDSLLLPRITALFATVAGLYAAGHVIKGAWPWIMGRPWFQ